MATQPQQALAQKTWRSNIEPSRLTLVKARKNWYTGLPPSLCPGFQNDIYSLTQPDFKTCTRQSVLDYFNNSWTLTESLFSSLNSDEAFYRPPYHGLRHPLIFYYVHPATLFINKLLLAGLIDHQINPYFERLFETGVDEMSWDDMSKNDIEWPTIEDCHTYRQEAYIVTKSVIETHPDLSRPSIIDMSHPLWALFMGIEHERIHLETSSVLIRELPLNLVSPPKSWPSLAPRSSTKSLDEHSIHNKLIEVSETQVNLGKQKDFATFGWDNEYGCESLKVAGFQVSPCLVSNQDFLSFVNENAYLDERYWSEEGNKWRNFTKSTHPHFWVQDDKKTNQFKLRTCFELIDMPWNWACIVNFHEAKAYCAWKSSIDNRHYNLINESQHKVLKTLSKTQTNYNFNLKYCSESAVDAHHEKVNDTDCIYDISGNVWQWSEDAFRPLPGFFPHPLYNDFSTPCFDGKHQMILGGSFISTGDEASIYARFHFRPHFFQHSGFRLVCNDVQIQS